MTSNTILMPPENMDRYQPADNRARITLNNILHTYIQNVTAATTIPELRRAFTSSLLPGPLAADIELRVRFRGGTTIEVLRLDSIEVAQDIIGYRVCRDLNLPSEVAADTSRVYYYMREHIIDWHRRYPSFDSPGNEIITIDLSGRTLRQTLTEDQLLGIAYAIDGMNNETLTLTSSLTSTPIDVHALVMHALTYRLPTMLATEELKRPYRVEVRQSDGSYIRLRFIHPEFMQGILSVAHWYNLPHRGRGTLWRSLEQFTRERIIPLGI